MSLPSKNSILTLDYSSQGQPAAYIEAKTLSPSSNTLDYTLNGQPAIGLVSLEIVTLQNGAFLMFFA